MSEERLPQLMHDALRSPGRTFAVVLDSTQQLMDALGAAEEIAGGAGMIKRVKHTNGDQEIGLVNGARIIFRTYRQSLRGRTLEVILVHPDVRSRLTSSRAGITLRRTLAGGTAWDGWLEEHMHCCEPTGGHLTIDW